jgi:hypothetical protein
MALWSTLREALRNWGLVPAHHVLDRARLQKASIARAKTNRRLSSWLSSDRQASGSLRVDLCCSSERRDGLRL